MFAPASQFALRAKQREIASLQLLADRIKLVDLIGRTIHVLQRERGITSIFLASGGKRFSEERMTARGELAPLAAQLQAHLELQLAPERDASSRMLALIAWVLLDLDSLDALRGRIDRRGMSAPASVLAFSKVIGGLMELVFQLADGAPEPAISRLLVALVHVVQGKEEAGQERAVGAHMFASGGFPADQQQRLLHLIHAQDSSLDVFENFADAAQADWWTRRALTPHAGALMRLRRILCGAQAGEALDASLTESWFDASSARITDLWHLQLALTALGRAACDASIALAQQALRDSEALLQALRDTPPTHAQALDHFFAGDGAPVPSDTLIGADRATISSLKSVLEAQSARLARMEVELDEARRALHERKLVQRAKHALMARHGLSEDVAFRLLQKTSMDRNRSLVELAEEILISPETVSFSPGHARADKRSS
ncbi:nitrate- and nitrite sensing domain-containing protein [Caballeronia sp. LZ065]|uniref:nitrate- and nitrite sensing domain-containing protein n=1 Tax=Caballeronia sp. LZ065 TaxID=3038571 RepID=UPI0028554703|nr:nitrate- and nitrite sensing domain-containing protein [Caballeronia sp. LZ065]MDR5784802.1 nitrate- and nitrite sensing domain-containing protein [Caballeronia sp. LZ065]